MRFEMIGIRLSQGTWHSTFWHKFTDVLEGLAASIFHPEDSSYISLYFYHSPRRYIPQHSIL